MLSILLALRSRCRIVGIGALLLTFLAPVAAFAGAASEGARTSQCECSPTCECDPCLCGVEGRPCNAECGCDCCPPDRSDQVPPESLVRGDDEFLEGYLQALIDMHYYETGVGVHVVDGVAYLSNLPANCLVRDSILCFVGDHPLVCDVAAVEGCYDDCHCSGCTPGRRSGPIWLPQNTVLFAPLVADPRQVSYSVAFRFHDQGVADSIVAISFGDEFPLIRWRNVGPWCGDLQIDLEAGAFGIFDAELESTPLLNTDYYVALPLTYAVESWAFRLRVWHISSHLGDEFMANNPGFARLNLSKEALDFYASYQMTCAIRYYAGAGYIFHEDEEFEREDVYLEYGTELRLWGCQDRCDRVYGTPFFAMHFRHWHDPVVDDWDNNRTFALGYEWSKLSGIGRKMRLFLEYHEGFSLEGQFSRVKTEYLAFKLAYGF